jgi:hypothetical protein
VRIESASLISSPAAEKSILEGNKVAGIEKKGNPHQGRVLFYWYQKDKGSDSQDRQGLFI